MKKVIFWVLIGCLLSGCDEAPDQVQHDQQEALLMEGTSQTGMPAIKNFRERKLLKDIYELRDRDGLVTYTYVVAENTGKFVFLCDSIGYGISAATQYTNPSAYQKVSKGVMSDWEVLPQAEPNGLFSPSSADGTWVMCNDPVKNKAAPLYVEPRVIVSTFKLSN